MTLTTQIKGMWRVYCNPDPHGSVFNTDDYIARAPIYYIYNKGLELEMDGISIRRLKIQ
jgi:hypothetical protein